MKVYNNELYVSQGEEITVDFEIQNPDGSPYIVSSEITNPYYLVTFANSRYTQQNQYKLNLWLKIGYPSTPTFISTNAKSYTGDFSKNEYPDTDYGDGYYYSNAAVYYKGSDYRYFKYTSPGTFAHQGTWVSYEGSHIRFSIASEETLRWTEQEYLWSIALADVDGFDDNDKPTGYRVLQTILSPTRMYVTTKLSD